MLAVGLRKEFVEANSPTFEAAGLLGKSLTKWWFSHIVRRESTSWSQVSFRCSLIGEVIYTHT